MIPYVHEIEIWLAKRATCLIDGDFKGACDGPYNMSRCTDEFMKQLKIGINYCYLMTAALSEESAFVFDTLGCPSGGRDLLDGRDEVWMEYNRSHTYDHYLE